MLLQLLRLRSLWEMLLSQGLLLSPNLLPKLLLHLQRLHPRGVQGIYLLRKRTRPQCLKWKRKKLKLKF